MEYHEICLWLPYKQETVEDIANDMLTNGYRHNHPIVTYEGKILDGRHRYAAAKEVNLEPEYEVFEGTTQEAISFVTSENINRRMLSKEEKEEFYVHRANASGVQTRGGNGNNQHQSGNTQNCGIAPSQKDHADALGVHVNTISNWEKDRKEVFENPDNSDLVDLANTPGGYKEAKKESKNRADQIREDLSTMTPDEQVEYLGGPQKVVDQKALDNKLEKDFVPYNAALTVLNSLNRLRIFGGKREIKGNILHALDTSARFQSYEAEALLMLAEVVEEHKEELKAMCLQEVNLNKLN